MCMPARKDGVVGAGAVGAGGATIGRTGLVKLASSSFGAGLPLK